MKVRVPDYYDEFVCLGSACPDTCCVGWVIEIDDASYQRFQALKGTIGRRVMENIILSPEGKPVFKLDENARCAFLNKENLCQMYIDLGPDSQCSLCDNYPRIGEEFGSLRELGLSISCPEVARLILNHSAPIAYQEWEIQEPVTGTDYCKDAVFGEILNLRETAVFIAQNKHIAVCDRLKLYIVMASQMQAAMDKNDYRMLAQIEERFSDEAYLMQVVATFCGSAHDKTEKADQRSRLTERIYKFMEKLDYISPRFVNLLEAAASDSAKTETFAKTEAFAKAGEAGSDLGKERTLLSDKAVENLLVYLILRYFMKIIYDGDIYSKAAFAAFFIVTVEDLLRKTGEKPETVVYLFSKEIEHCEENMEMLSDWFWSEPWNNPAEMIEML